MMQSRCLFLIQFIQRNWYIKDRSCSWQCITLHVILEGFCHHPYKLQGPLGAFQKKKNWSSEAFRTAADSALLSKQPKNFPSSIDWPPDCQGRNTSLKKNTLRIRWVVICNDSSCERIALRTINVWQYLVSIQTIWPKCKWAYQRESSLRAKQIDKHLQNKHRS